MAFLTALSLALGALVVLPYLAHRLRRRQADEIGFAPVDLIDEVPPKARRRGSLENRLLFAIRAGLIVALAVLGASPLVRCSRLSLSRSGASVAVALVVDDSMSMRVGRSGRAQDPSPFRRAREGARQVVESLREGDAVAVVLAGAPARIALAPTTDLSAARLVVDSLKEADRATDLEASLLIAEGLIRGLPHVDQRLLVFSDRADGQSGAPPLGEGVRLPLSDALPDLAEAHREDCALLTADRAGNRVRVRFACGATHGVGRKVRLLEKERAVGEAPLPDTQTGEVWLELTTPGAAPTVASLTGSDGWEGDDHTPILTEAGPLEVGLVDDARGGEGVRSTPFVEHALSAMRLEVTLRPSPQCPDRIEEMDGWAALIVDDPPGFTPEQRRALSRFVDRGGMLLAALGPRAAAAPLGSTFEPFLSTAVTYTRAVGGLAADGSAFFGETALSAVDLAAKGRIRFADADLGSVTSLARWSDGAPFLVGVAPGRGEGWFLTLPFSATESDFPLKPAFLGLLDSFAAEVQKRSARARTEVGVPWMLTPLEAPEVVGPVGPLAAAHDDHGWHLTPDLAGAYVVTVGGVRRTQVASVPERELDFRPHALTSTGDADTSHGGKATVDISWVVALLLVVLFASEVVVRLVAHRGSR